ncbi:hypothetical protein BaRGS_00005947, partial [Batillaria attramentaria]
IAAAFKCRPEARPHPQPTSLHVQQAPSHYAPRGSTSSAFVADAAYCTAVAPGEKEKVLGDTQPAQLWNSLGIQQVQFEVADDHRTSFTMDGDDDMANDYNTVDGNDD